MNELIRLYRWAMMETNITVNKHILSDIGIAQQEARIISAQIVLDILEGKR